MDTQIESFDEQTEEQINIALDELRSVQFCNNTYTQAVEAHEEVEGIIRALAKCLIMNEAAGFTAVPNSTGDSATGCPYCGVSAEDIANFNQALPEPPSAQS